MPIRLICPNNHELVVEMEHIGKKVRCPACKVVMVVPDPRQGVAPAPQQPMHYPQQPPSYPPQQPMPQPMPQAAPRQQMPPPMQQGVQPRGAPPAMPRRPPEPIEELEELPELEDEDRPRKKKKGQTRGRMRLCNIGLAFHYAKLLCMIVMIGLAVLSFLILPLMALGGGGEAMYRIAQITGLISLILFPLTPVLGGVGSLLCFWVPEKSRSKVLVIVSFSLEVGSIAIVIIAFIAAMGGTSSAVERGDARGMAAVGAMFLVMLFLAFLAFLASFIMFMLFLRAMGRYIGDRMCAEEAIRQMAAFLGVLLGGFLGIFILGIVLRNAGMVGGIIGLVAVVLWQLGVMMTLFGILNLIGTLRAHINSRWG